MLAYTLKRLLAGVVTVFFIATATFAAMHAVPGDPLTSGKARSAEIRANLKARYGLDRPVLVQYGVFLRNMAKGDFGISFTQQNRSVNDIIREHFPVSAILGVLALLFATVGGVLLGSVTARFRGRWADRSTLFFVVLGISVPGFVFAALSQLGVLVLNQRAGGTVLPVAGWGTFGHMLLPALTLGIGTLAFLTRLMRSSLLEIVNQDYIRTAKAKGLPPWRIFLSHQLRNGILPVITLLGPGARRDHDGRVRRGERVRDPRARALLRPGGPAARLHRDHGAHRLLRRVPRADGGPRRHRLRLRRSADPRREGGRVTARDSGPAGESVADAARARGAAAGAGALRPEDFVPVARAGLDRGPTRPSLSYWRDAWLRLKKNRQATVSLVIVCALLLFTLAGPLLWRVNPSKPELSRLSEPPRWDNRAEVLAEPPPFEELVAPGVPPAPEADGATLAAPASLAVVGRPTVEAVRLRWSPVPGAAGYLVYRSTSEPAGDYLGLPMGEVPAGNVVSFEDAFNLEPTTYWYSVVATNGAESRRAATLEVKLTPGISLVDAKTIDPGAKPGDVVARPRRPLGTDFLGRDLLARLMSGARVSLFIGFTAPLLAILIGVVLGGVSGYFGGRVDHWLMRFTDFVLALPFLLFMILFKVAFGSGPGESGVAPMLVAMIVLSWTGAARLTRGQVLQLREREFVQASRLLGARPAYLILRHLLPNTLGVILVSLTFAIPSAIFTEAFLSFIGMGVAAPTASWGSMCNDGIKTFLVYPHEFLFPAAAISVTVLAFNLLGDGLRDALDPRMRSVE